MVNLPAVMQSGLCDRAMHMIIIRALFFDMVVPVAIIKRFAHFSIFFLWKKRYLYAPRCKMVK